MSVLLKKELWEQWRTYRFLVVAAVLVLFGLASPPMARYLPELLKSLPGVPPGLVIPAATLADAITQYLKNLTQFGVILALLVPMGMVAQEKDRGTAAMLLSKPVSRASFLLAKYLALALCFLASLVLAGVAGYYYTGILFEWMDPGSFALLNGLLLLDLLVYLALTLLASTITRSLPAAGGLTLGLYALLWIAGIVPQVARNLPDALPGWGAQLVLSPLAVEPAWGALGVSGGIIVAALLLAWFIFRRQEI
jgi:ABC-2 type transport system permease protein